MARSSRHQVSIPLNRVNNPDIAIGFLQMEIVSIPLNRVNNKYMYSNPVFINCFNPLKSGQ